jgi:hypothetical protein
MEDMGGSYRDNLAANVTTEQMAKKSANFKSIKGPQIIPIPSVWNIVPAGLHILLMIGLMIIMLLEFWSDFLDKETDQLEIGAITDILDDQDEEREEEVEVMTETATTLEVASEPVAAGSSATTAPNPSREARYEAKMRLEAELRTAKAKVLLQEASVLKEVMVVKKMKILEMRVHLNDTAGSLMKDGKKEEAYKKYSEVEQLAKEENTDKRFRTAFKFCSDFCLLTGNDKVVWQLCSGCHEKCHVYCELWDVVGFAPRPEPEEGQDGNLCNTCRAQPFTSFGEMQEMVKPHVREAEDQLTRATIKLEDARAEEYELVGKLKELVGPHRRELLRILEELGVYKTAYQGGTYVGNDCQKILQNADKLATVLDSVPEVKELFKTFAKTYLEVHYLIKASRWLKDTEVRNRTSAFPALK